MRTSSDQHGTLSLAHRCTEALVAVGKRRMDEKDFSVAAANQLAQALGQDASTTVQGLDPAAIGELAQNMRHSMDFRFGIAEDSMDLEEALHIAIAFMAWAQGTGNVGIQLHLAMQWVECALQYVLPRTRAAAAHNQRAMVAGQCRQLIAFVQRTTTSVASYQAWCTNQSALLQHY